MAWSFEHFYIASGYIIEYNIILINLIYYYYSTYCLSNWIYNLNIKYSNNRIITIKKKRMKNVKHE